MERRAEEEGPMEEFRRGATEQGNLGVRHSRSRGVQAVPPTGCRCVIDPPNLVPSVSTHYDLSGLGALTELG